MAITAQMVKELREKTGIAMMECKKALTETDGDMEKAVELLRKKGMATAEKKVVNIYNHDAGKEVPTECPVLMALVNKPVKVAVHQMEEDKNKTDAAGQYVPTGQTRKKNECKFFGDTTGRTVEEILAGDDPTVFDEWAKTNTGIVIDKTTKQKSTSAADIMNGENTDTPDTTASLFS